MTRMATIDEAIAWLGHRDLLVAKGPEILRNKAQSMVEKCGPIVAVYGGDKFYEGHEADEAQDLEDCPPFWYSWVRVACHRAGEKTWYNLWRFKLASPPPVQPIVPPIPR